MDQPWQGQEKGWRVSAYSIQAARTSMSKLSCLGVGAHGLNCSLLPQTDCSTGCKQVNHFRLLQSIPAKVAYTSAFRVSRITAAFVALKHLPNTHTVNLQAFACGKHSQNLPVSVNKTNFLLPSRTRLCQFERAVFTAARSVRLQANLLCR